MLISVELNRATTPSAGEGEVEIYVDEEGVRHLISQLGLMRDRKTEHIHLMAPEWGGDELAATTHRSGNVSVPHVKIVLKRTEQNKGSGVID